MKTHILLFAIAATIPPALVATGALAGGAWPFVALAWITVVAWTLDRMVGAETPADPGDTPRGPANAVSVLLALAHFAVLYTSVLVISGTTGELGGAARVALFIAAGLFLGQVSNANAHELIHRSGRFLNRLGVAIYTSLLFGHHASAHPLVHHVHVATPRDPNTAREGESFYRFAPRAWIGSFRAGLAAETARRQRAGKRGLHPYAIYVLGAFAALAVSAGIAGPVGVLVHLGLAAYATVQLLLSDYVQHYGLRREPLPDGKPEPVRPAHSWNAPHWYTSLMMLNAPRHSDHHAHPARAYPSLTLPPPDEAPRLPASLPVMATLALFPARWKKVMARELEQWCRAR